MFNTRSWKSRNRQNEQNTTRSFTRSFWKSVIFCILL